MGQMKLGTLDSSLLAYKNGLGWEKSLVNSLLNNISRTHSGKLMTQVENEICLSLERIGNNMIDALDEDMEHKWASQ